MESLEEDLLEFTLEVFEAAVRVGLLLFAALRRRLVLVEMHANEPKVLG